jgi:hypothetical protein
MHKIFEDIDVTSSLTHINYTADSILLPVLLKRALNNDEPIYRYTCSGTTNKSKDSLVKFIKSIDGKIIDTYDTKYNASYMFKWDNSGILHLAYTKHNRNFTLSFISNNEDLCKKVQTYGETLTINKVKKGYVFSIMRNSQGNLSIQEVGYAGSTLEKRNYTKSVISDYEYIISDLKSSSPSGRIVILDSPPGHGKTYLVRGLLADANECMFVIVPPSMVSSLGGPDLLPLLISTKRDFAKKGPIVLILEDADQCLVPRGADNITSISSILNMGDGILGSLLDIRIIATTNAKHSEMDPAITRDGRLSKRIEIGALEYDHANAIFQRLIKNDSKTLLMTNTFSKNNVGFSPLKKSSSIALATVYKEARNNGWVPEEIVRTDMLGQDYSDDDQDHDDSDDDDSPIDIELVEEIFN